jgi:hypothetical protein
MARRTPSEIPKIGLKTEKDSAAVAVGTIDLAGSLQK